MTTAEPTLDALALDYAAELLPEAEAARFEALLLESDSARDALVRAMAIKVATLERVPAKTRWRPAAIAAAALLIGTVTWCSRSEAKPAASDLDVNEAALIVDRYLDLRSDDAFQSLDPDIEVSIPETRDLPEWFDASLPR